MAYSVSRKSNSVESFIKDSKKWCGPYDQGQRKDYAGCTKVKAHRQYSKLKKEETGTAETKWNTASVEEYNNIIQSKRVLMSLLSHTSCWPSLRPVAQSSSHKTCHPARCVGRTKLSCCTPHGFVSACMWRTDFICHFLFLLNIYVNFQADLQREIFKVLWRWCCQSTCMQFISMLI